MHAPWYIYAYKYIVTHVHVIYLHDDINWNIYMHTCCRRGLHTASGVYVYIDKYIYIYIYTVGEYKYLKPIMHVCKYLYS